VKTIRILVCLLAIASVTMANAQVRPALVIQGVVRQVLGSSFVVQTNIGGAYTVHTTPRTVVVVMHQGARSRAVPGVARGDQVTVRGTPVGRAIVASSIMVRRLIVR
jgi:hypothetical protein